MKQFKMKNIITFICLFIMVGCSGQIVTRSLKQVTFSGSGYDLGLQHGKALKSEIGDIISQWKKNTSGSLGKDADIVLEDFFKYAAFDDDIKKWTPELYEEVKGIAVGSGQRFNDVLVLNLLDEFWVYVNNLANHHCSSAGVPASDGQPAYISQNMDLENYTDGFQVLMRLERSSTGPEQLILTHPGLIGLNGLNENGIGVCVNTLMQLKASSAGLPVAFIIRNILQSTNKEKLLSFIQTVPHASGQNYLIGIKNEVYDFEASANKVVRYDPKNKNGTLYHTNHPIVNDDVKPWFGSFNPNAKVESTVSNSNSHLRFSAVEKRLVSSDEITDGLLKEALRSKDNQANPVCRSNDRDNRAFTFASSIMTLSGKPSIQILAGPPDESDYIKVDFSTKK